MRQTGAGGCTMVRAKANQPFSVARDTSTIAPIFDLWWWDAVTRQRITPAQDDQASDFKWARRSQSKGRIHAMLDLAKSDPEFWSSADRFDRPSDQLNVKNGTADLRTGEIRQHRPDDYISKIPNVEFDPDAKAPRFNQFVSEIFQGDRELQAFVQRCVGYSITGDVSKQVFFLRHGNGPNGKSVLLEVLQDLIGSYGINIRAETLMAKQFSQSSNEVARLAGARVATASEIDFDSRLNESLLKDITGRDTVTARFLYKEAVDFYPQAKIWMLGNHRPKIRGRDHGIWRRVLIIPFTRQFNLSERDPRLIKTLRNERSGVLNWAIAGCA